MFCYQYGFDESKYVATIGARTLTYTSNKRLALVLSQYQKTRPVTQWCSFVDDADAWQYAARLFVSLSKARQRPGFALLVPGGMLRQQRTIECAVPFRCSRALELARNMLTG